MAQVIFWQVQSTHHMVGAMNSFAKYWQGDVLGIFDGRMSSRRRQLGWKEPILEGIQSFFLEDQSDAKGFVTGIVERYPNAIHILSGIKGCRSVELALPLLLKEKKRFSLIVERPNDLSKAFVKTIYYKWRFWQLRNRIDVVFAMGELGCRAFHQFGIPKEKIFPFIYQSEMSSNKTIPSKDIKEKIDLVYVGNFGVRKGVFHIINLAKNLPENMTLTFVGMNGEYQKEVEDLAVSYPAVSYVGPVASNEVVSTLQQFDLCLVPSLHDGWGMVTNEALEAGIGVIVSDRVGSKDLVEYSGAGCIIPADSSEALIEAVVKLACSPQVVADFKQKATDYRSRLSGEEVGRYLFDVLEHKLFDPSKPRPRAPWGGMTQ